MISHALSYGATIAILILPKDKKSLEQSLVKLGGVGEEFQIDVYEYYYDLANLNLEEEEISLVKALDSLLLLTN